MIFVGFVYYFPYAKYFYITLRIEYIKSHNELNTDRSLSLTCFEKCVVFLENMQYF